MLRLYTITATDEAEAAPAVSHWAVCVSNSGSGGRRMRSPVSAADGLEGRRRPNTLAVVTVPMLYSVKPEDRVSLV